MLSGSTSSSLNSIQVLWNAIKLIGADDRLELDQIQREFGTKAYRVLPSFFSHLESAFSKGF